MTNYKRNHYVPEWYQRNFISAEAKEQKFYYLDLHPEVLSSGGHRYTRKAVRYLGPDSCFKLDDLYTTKFGEIESTEIEQYFFGEIDQRGKKAVEYFQSFRHPSADGEAFNDLLLYMSIQKLRTPKGLQYLRQVAETTDKNFLLLALQDLQHMHCAIWTECIWSLADATSSDLQFILSDHPVTVYNQGCYPKSPWSRKHGDPDIRFSGTHTIFALSQARVLIFTNLSWVRNPYKSPLRTRPNPDLFRRAVFNFTAIQTGRTLSNEEVMKINYIIKSRAQRYVAAGDKEWLFPERHVKSTHWDRFGTEHLLMPDPRSVDYSSQTIIGYKDKRSDIFDEYGRRPEQPGFKLEKRRDEDWETFHRFKGEFARKFGPKRRGIEFSFGSKDRDEDSPEYHAYHLSLESKFGAKSKRSKRRLG